MPGRLQGTLLTCPVGYCPAGVQGTVLGIAVDLSALPYLLCPFPGPHRVSVLGRLVSVGSDCASRRRAVSRGSMQPQLETWVRVGSERCSSLARPFGRRGGPESEVSVVPPWLGLLVGDWIALLAYPFGIWACPGVARYSQRRLLGRTFAGKPVHEGPRVLGS